MRRKEIGIIIFTIFSIEFSFPVNLMFDVKFGFGGYCVPGYWAPLSIKINQDIKSGTIEIERINYGNNTVKDIFPCIKNNTVECPVLVDENANGLKVRLFSGKELLIERDINPNEKIFPGHIILTNKMNSRIQQAISHCLFPDEPVAVVQVNTGELPSVAQDYDCISAVIMPDPGILITPAQLKALKFWVDCGGRLIMFDLLPGDESLLGKFEGKASPGKNSVSVESVYGKITGFYDEASLTDFCYKADEWRKILDIKPFVYNSRLTMSKSFAATGNFTGEKNDNSNLRILILTIVAIWIAGFFIILLFVKRKIFILSIFTMAAMIAFIPCGNMLKRIWHGGAQYHNRMLILPGGVMMEKSILFPSGSGNEIFADSYSAWGVTADFGISEKAFLKPGIDGDSFVLHNTVKPVNSLKDWTTRSMSITAYGSADVLDGYFVSDLLEKSKGSIAGIKDADFKDLKYLELVKGNGLDPEWWSWDGTDFRWVKNQTVPAWLENDLEWISRLKKMKPGYSWLVGYDAIPGAGFRLQGEICPMTLWAMPVI
jgi:hypothetical protein